MIDGNRKSFFLSRAEGLLLPALYIIIAGIISGIGMGQHVFWDDEANTAIFARNILRFGEMTAWDGTNVLAFRGGVHLDERLMQATFLPLQHYAAAAGIWLLGETTVGGRIPFLVAGLATLWVVQRWAAALMGTRFPAWLPPLLLALNVPYLLYIRQCRYYALALLLCAGLFWACVGLRDTPRRWIAYLGGAAAAVGLVCTNFMLSIAAVAAVAVLPAHPQFRTRQHAAFLALVGGLVGVGILLVLTAHYPTETVDSLRSDMSVVKHFTTLMGWQLTGLGAFEFYPAAAIPLLALPYLVARLKPYRELATKAWLMLLAMLLFLAVIAAVSPQNLDVTNVADMRYVVPVMLMGSIATACAVVIAAAWFGRAAAALLAVGAIVLTNFAYLGVSEVRCTLCEFIHETAVNHPSGTDAAVAYARTLPRGTLIRTIPENMTTSLQFYLPNLRYPGVLDPDKKLDPKIRAVLPGYLFAGSVPAEVLLVGVGSIRLTNEFRLEGHEYRVENRIKTFWIDETRPELPWHRFRADPVKDERYGIVVLRLAAGSGGSGDTERAAPR